MNRGIMLKIALVGYGKMGKCIEQLASADEFAITAKINSRQNSLKTKISEAHICIDFTNPQAFLRNLEEMAEMKKNIVVGTTGWEEQAKTVKSIVEKYNIGLIYSPNFSIGVHLFLKLIEEAAKLFDPFPLYDVAGSEFHHRQKGDSPSGTAKAIAQILLKNLSRKETLLDQTCEGIIDPKALHFCSMRCGSMPGSHSVYFDSPVDTITISHQARSRDGFALGALTAAKWIVDKIGFYTINDMIKEFYERKT